MTNHPTHGSTIETRDSELDALILDSTSPSNTSPVSHSFNPRHLKHAHRHHHHHLIRRCHKRCDTHGAPINHSKKDANQQKVSDDSHSLDTPEPITVDANVYARADIKPFTTRVVQTISLIQFVDHSGNPIQTQTRRGLPNTVVVDIGSGITISASNADHSQNAILPLPGVGDKASNHVTSTSTYLTVTQSSSTSSSSSSSLASLATSYPTLTDVKNGTHPLTANSTVAPSNSTVKPFALSTASSGSNSTRYRIFSHASSSTLTDISSTYASITSTEGSFDSSMTATSAPTSSSVSSESSSGTADLSPQQRQVIGGVVGGVAGAAVLALLVLLVLRWKRKRDNRASLNDEDPGSSTARALPGTAGDSSGPYGSMTEQAAGSAAVMGAFAALTGRKPQNTPAASTGERGFYRVSGRKLPSVLTAGGDGYTDPRESALSDNSNYSDQSQSSEPMGPRSAPYALGTPMRPVSGIPIMRSGPARTPVQEANPFADPAPSPFADPRPAPAAPSPPKSSPARSLGQRDSPRMSGSRFQERI